MGIRKQFGAAVSCCAMAVPYMRLLGLLSASVVSVPEMLLARPSHLCVMSAINFTMVLSECVIYGNHLSSVMA